MRMQTYAFAKVGICRQAAYLYQNSRIFDSDTHNNGKEITVYVFQVMLAKFIFDCQTFPDQYNLDDK